jgi:hypothetical protein
LRISAIAISVAKVMAITPKARPEVNTDFVQGQEICDRCFKLKEDKSIGTRAEA